MKRSNQVVKKGEDSKTQKRNVSPSTVAKVLAQIHASDFEDDMSEPESTPRPTRPSQIHYP